MAELYRVGFSAESQRLLEQAFSLAPDRVQRRLMAFMRDAVDRLDGVAQENTPTDQGTLRNSIIGSVRVLDAGLGVEGVVGTSQPYALPVELGARPHWAPLAPLVDWVKRKFPLGAGFPLRGARGDKRKRLLKAREDEATRIAKSIRFAIARRGTSAHQRALRGKPGAEMFGQAYDAEVRGIEQDFAQLARDLAAGL